MPEDISTTGRAAVDSVEDTRVTPEVSGVAAAVETSASAVIEEDLAKLTVHPETVVTPLADRVQMDSEDNRRIDSSARVVTVDTKTVVPGEGMDTAVATAEG